MPKSRVHATLLAGMILLGFLSGCGGPVVETNPLRAKIGRSCTVQFRRGDGLGAGGVLPVSPTTSGINGAEVSVYGKLSEVGDGWITIVAEKVEYNIPRESILLIAFGQ